VSSLQVPPSIVASDATALTIDPAVYARAPQHRAALRFLDQHRPATPVLVLEVAQIERQLAALRRALWEADVLFAVKACPSRPVIEALVALGIGFDVASPAEVDLCLAAGASPDRLSYGNVAKKAADIGVAAACGVRTFVFDGEEELQKIAVHAPGAKVVCRLRVEGGGALWPLTRKFGCAPATAARLLVRAPQLGLVPVGITFHVGSQQLDPERWGPAIEAAAEVFRATASAGVHLDLLDIGGGFPAHYAERIPTIERYAAAIRAALERSFGDDQPQLVCEPSRSLAADAGVIRAEVVLVTRKDPEDTARWVYLDIGRFGGLAETEGEAIRYALRTNRDGSPVGPAILAGPTCDSIDVLYEQRPCMLPLDLEAGDTVDILSAGAYTASYASHGFNGFRSPTVYCLR
jgi:ornithine decarboxylase